MGREGKIARAGEHMEELRKIQKEVAKLDSRYQHHFTAARNLFKKAQVEIPDNMRYSYGYIHYTFE